MKIAFGVAGFLGLALATYLIVAFGAADLWTGLVAMGWGLLAVVAFHLVPLVFNTLSWRSVVPAARRPGFAVLLWIRWLRESVNNLLPVAQVGGDIVCIRLVHLRGVPAPAAIASMVVDLSVGVLAQLAFVTAGLVLLLSYSSEPLVLSVVRAVLIGLGILLTAMAAFLYIQRAGLFAMVARLAAGLTSSPLVARLGAMAAEIDAATRATYRDKRAFWTAMAWRLGDWVAGTGEVWLLLYFLGKPVSLGEAMVLESLGTGVRAAAFLVPGAIGVLEGSFIIFGSLFGLTAADSLALALGKRVRELVIGVPGLVAWQLAEGRRYLGRLRGASRPPAP